MNLCVARWAAVLILIGTQGDLVKGQTSALTPLPYKRRPLVQEGTGNLLPSPGFADRLKGWDVWGDVSIVEIAGERCLRFGPKKDREVSRIRVYVPKPRGGVLYLLRFEIKICPETEFAWDDSHPGINGWLSHAIKGKIPIGPVAIREMRRGNEWLRREFRLFSHPKTEALYVLLGFNAVKGCALIRRWELLEEPIAAKEGRGVLETPSGDWAELPHPIQPTALPEPALWAANDLDELRPYSCPTPDDLRRPLKLAGTPGEMCVAALGLYTPKAVPKVILSFTPLKGNAGELASTPTWRQICFRPRRSDYSGRGMTFHYVPDFFVVRPDGVSCSAEQATGFWINLRLPKDAKPGTYTGEVRAVAQGLEVKVPVEVQVYPFALAELPNKIRHLYMDCSRWRHMSDEQVLAELADVRDHGYESISLSSAGTVSVENGRITGYQLSADSERYARLALQSGLKGPFLFSATYWVKRDLGAKLGLGDALQGNADTWPPAFASAAVDMLKFLKLELVKMGIKDPVLMAVDEPGYWKKGSPELFAWDVQVGQGAGWPVY